MSDSSEDLIQTAKLDQIESLIDQGKFKEALAEAREEEARCHPDKFFCEHGWLCHLTSRSLRGLGRYKEALTNAKDALSVFKTTLENEKLAQIQLNLGIVHNDLGDLKNAEVQFWDSAASYRRADNKVGMARAHRELSRLCFIRGRYEAAIEHLRNGLEYCNKNEDQKLIASILGNLGTVCMISDRWNEGKENLLKSLRLKTACKHDVDVCCCHLSLTYLSLLLRQFPEAKEHLKKAYRIISQNGYIREEAIYHEYSGELAFAQGDLKTAYEHFLKVISLGEQIAPRSAIISQGYRLLAEVQVEKGDLKEAMTSCERSLLVSRKIGERLEEAVVHRILGCIYSKNGHPADVKKNFNQALCILEEIGTKFELAKTYLLMGRCDNFSFWERMKFLSRAEDLTCRLDTPYYLAKVHTDFAEFFLREGKLTESRDFLDRARPVFEKLDEKKDLEWLSVLEKKAKLHLSVDESAPATDSDICSFGDIVTQDKTIWEIIESSKQVKDSDISILLEGETGTGKDLLAKAIHYESNRKGGKFVVASCAALPEGLFESELFGHKRGSFTGAVADKKGLVDEANGGTLYLDEIAEVPLNIQVKLLRAIEEKEIVRVGEVKPRKVDFRVIAATNRDLNELVDRGMFRNDLFYRLNGIRLKLTPLRERKDDIALLVEHFLRRYCLKGVSKNRICDTRRPYSVPSVDSEVMETLLLYNWPGNVRELENIVKQMFITCAGEQRIAEKALTGVLDKLKNMNCNEDEKLSLLEKRRQYEKKEIEKALIEANGNKSQAARSLGIDEALLRYKMKTLGIVYNR